MHGVVLVYCCHDNLSLKMGLDDIEALVMGLHDNLAGVMNDIEFGVMDLDDIVASAMNLDDIEVLLYGCHDNFALEMDLDDNVVLGKG